MKRKANDRVKSITLETDLTVTKDQETVKLGIGMGEYWQPPAAIVARLPEMEGQSSPSSDSSKSCSPKLDASNSGSSTTCSTKFFTPATSVNSSQMPNKGSASLRHGRITKRYSLGPGHKNSSRATNLKISSFRKIRTRAKSLPGNASTSQQGIFEITGIDMEKSRNSMAMFQLYPRVWGYLESGPEFVEPIYLYNAAKSRERRPHALGYQGLCNCQRNDCERHLCIIYSPARLPENNREVNAYIVDKGSKGVCLNGQKLQHGKEIELRHNDVITLWSSSADKVIDYKIKMIEVRRLLPEKNIQKLYTMKSIIGHGAFGEVYRAECQATQRQVAIKVTNIAKNDTITRGSLLREISIQTVLRNHPCIISIDRVLERDGAFYIVMELGEQGDLFDYIQQTEIPLPEDKIRIVFDQIFQAVAYIHSRKVAHRDLKLENIIVMDKGTFRVKVADLGLANFEPDNKLFKTRCGTPQYAAPEMLANQSYTSAVDIWSLGVMLYTAFSRSHPFDVDPNNANSQRTMGQTLRMQILHEDVKFNSDVWSDISKEGKDLITKMLTKDPAKRLTIKEVLAHPWLSSVERCPDLVKYLQEQASLVQ